MNNYSISFKLKDYSPKINSIPYKNYICILIYENFQLKIPLLLNNDFINSKHELKNIKSDINYKITLFDNKLKELIGLSDLYIPYKLIQKIKPNNSLLYEKQIKFLIGMRTKIKLFGSLKKIGDIYLNLTLKIFKKPNKNIKKKNDNNNNNNIINNYLINGLPNRFLTQKKNKSRNLLKKKFILNEKTFSKSKNKNQLTISDMSSENNKFVTLNDVNHSLPNTYSLIDDNSNEDENNNFNNITNIINYNYYWLNTSSSKNTVHNNISFKKNINNNRNSNSINNDKNSFHDLNDLFEKRNIIKKRINYNKIRKIKNNLKKSFLFQSKSKPKIKNLSNNKTEILTGRVGRKGLKWREKNKANISKKFLDCKGNYSLENFNLSVASKSSKSKPIISKIKYVNRHNKKQIKINKILLLNKENKNNSTHSNNKKLTKNKNISANIFHRAILSERINMSIDDEENNNNVNNKNTISSDIIKKNHKMLSSNNISYFKILKRNENILKKNNTQNVNNNTFSNIKFLSKFNKIDNKDSNDSISFRNKTSNIIINNNFKNKNIIKIKYNSIYNISYGSYQNKIKNYEIKLYQYFILNNLKLKSAYIKVKKNNKNLKFNQDLFLYSLKKSNKLEEKKSTLLIHNYIYNNIKNSINEKIKFPLMKIKKSEFKIYKNIFNLSYFDYDIIKYRDSEKKLNEKIINLELLIVKNLIEQYGNITQIFKEDKIKKEKLKNILRKNNIEEKNSNNKNNYIDLFALNKINCSVKKIIKNTFNNDVKYKFNIIKEEDKESEKSNNTFNNDITEEIFFIDKDNESDDNDVNLYKIENINFDNNKNYFCFNSPKNNNNDIEYNENIYNKYIRKKLNGVEKKFDYDETTDIDSESLDKKDIGFLWKRKKI